MRENKISNVLKNAPNPSFPLIIIFLGFIVISMPLQDAYAAITGVTIDNIAINNVIGAGFQLDYTITNNNVAPLNADDGVVTFARTGGTADPQATHTYTMIAGDLTGAVGGQAHTLTRATLELDGGFDVLVDGTIYTVTVSLNTGAVQAAVTGVTVDLTVPTFTAALAPASNQITITYSENVISAADSAAPWTLTGGFTVDAVTALDGGTNTQTLTLDRSIPDGSGIDVTYTSGGAGDITDDINVSPNALATATVPLVGIPPFSGQGSGCSGDCEAPTLGVNSEGYRFVTNGFTYNGKSTDVESFYTPYPLITTNVGQQNKAVFKIYENYGPQNIKHFSLAFGLGSNQIISLSKAMIELDIDFDGTETVTITDPENALENVIVKTSTGDCSGDSTTQCLIVTIDHTFRAPLEFNMVGTDVWDMRRNSWQNYYNHGIEVVGESLNPPNEYFGIYKGNLIHLIETGKNTAIDADGNTWTFDNIWIKDYIYKGKIVDGTPSHGFDRNHAKFDAYKQRQAQTALSLLEQICPQCIDKPFEEINDIFSYEFPVENDRLNAEVQKIILEESKTAQQKMEQMYPYLK